MNKPIHLILFANTSKICVVGYFCLRLAGTVSVDVLGCEGGPTANLGVGCSYVFISNQRQ